MSFWKDELRYRRAYLLSDCEHSFRCCFSIKVRAIGVLAVDDADHLKPNHANSVPDMCARVIRVHVIIVSKDLGIVLDSAYAPYGRDLLHVELHRSKSTLYVFYKFEGIHVKRRPGPYVHDVRQKISETSVNLVQNMLQALSQHRQAGRDSRARHSATDTQCIDRAEGKLARSWARNSARTSNFNQGGKTQYMAEPCCSSPLIRRSHLLVEIEQ